MKSRTIRLAAWLCLAAATGGCSTVVSLRNPETGATASCEAGGTTIAPQQTKQALIRECVDAYTKQGYQVVAVSK